MKQSSKLDITAYKHADKIDFALQKYNNLKHAKIRQHSFFQFSGDTTLLCSVINRIYIYMLY